jgi:hypothetical protein
MVLSEAISLRFKRAWKRKRSCFAKRPDKILPRPGRAMIRRCLEASLHESAWGLGADVELAGGTVSRCALAVHRR